jgi:hypothetical protein
MATKQNAQLNSHDSDTLELNERSMAFARAVVLDKDHKITKGQHYAKIYGSKATGSCLSKMASRLWRNPVVQAYVEELRAEVRKEFMVTVESLIEELQEIKLAALGAETPQCGAAVAAVMGKAKLAGLDKAIEKEAEQATPVRVIIQVEDASNREG